MDSNKRGRIVASLIGVLLALLLPVGAVLIFKFKEKDRVLVKIPKFYYPVGLDTIQDLNGKIRIDTLYHTIPYFNFTSQNKQAFTSDDVTGKIWIAEFFYTSCPGICPLMNSQMQRIQNEFMGDDKVIICSFTTDPVNDSAEVLKSYGERYNAVSGKWYFLTGSRDSLQALARNGFKITAIDGLTTDGEINHSNKLVLS